MRNLHLLLILPLLVACESNSSDDNSQSHAKGGSAGTNTNDSSGGSTAMGGSRQNGGNAGTSASSTVGGISGAGIAGAATAGAGNTAGAATAGAGNTAGAATAGMGAAAGSTQTANAHWVGSWATAQQLTEQANLPPSPGLTNNTLREIFQVSIGGSRIRLRFSNEYGSTPVTLQAVHCAKSVSEHTVDALTDKTLSFSGSGSVTIPAKQAVMSDPFDFNLMPLSKVAVSIYFGETSTDVTGHPGSRTTSYLVAGDASTAPSLAAPATTDHWYILSGLDVVADASAKAIVILGDSITDGRGSTTNAQNRWPDNLAKRLQANPSTANISVLNQGIGGNAVLTGGLGPTALTRFDGDVLGQRGVHWVIVFEGVNDIGGAAVGSTVATNLIAAYTQFITKAHAQGVLALGATITPFGSNGYYSIEHEAARQAVNQWIRTPGNFDGVIDFDIAVRDEAAPVNISATYDTGDGLHLNPTGYVKLADVVDLTWFAQ